MKKVQVLLSTYNGEKYIQEQIDSLLNQDYRNISILIRDDGSTDNTFTILEGYALKHNFIALIKGENIGVVASFFELIQNADLSADMFSFCDQDDIWQEWKISRAIEKISLQKEKSTPVLYFSRLTLTDEKLNVIKDTASPQHICPENAVVQNIVTGCTMMVNKKLLLLCMRHLPDVKNVYMHDWWFYLLASFMGKIVFDDCSCVLYRQHQNNVLGQPVNFWQWKREQIKYMFNKKGRELRIVQIHEFWKIAKDQIPNEYRKLILQFFDCQGNLIQRCKVSYKMPFRFQKSGSTWKLRLMILFNLY